MSEKKDFMTKPQQELDNKCVLLLNLIVYPSQQEKNHFLYFCHLALHFMLV